MVMYVAVKSSKAAHGGCTPTYVQGQRRTGREHVSTSIFTTVVYRMTAVYVLTVVLLSPSDEGLDCIVCNVRMYIATSAKLVPDSYTAWRTMMLTETFHGEGQRC